MNFLSTFKQPPRIYLGLLCLLMANLAPWRAIAEPYLAVKTGLKCQACHVNPDGGGMRNAYGRVYGQHELPATMKPFIDNDRASLTRSLSFGLNARFNANFLTDDNEQKQQSFDVDSANAYLYLDLPDSNLSFYLDQQVAPGSPLNREAWAMLTLNGGHRIKLGRLFLPYGLRLEDDSALIRQMTGMNFDNGDTGIDYSFDWHQSRVNIFISNGTSQVSNQDDRFLYGARLEHLFSSFRLGATAVVNDSEQQVQMFNLYGGYHFSDLSLLAEVDWLRQEGGNPQTGADVDQLITLTELNYQWRKGLNLKLTFEYLDPNQDIDEDERTRYSFVSEYTPMANLQLRLGIRVQQDIPQKATQNNEMIFVQSHFYF